VIDRQLGELLTAAREKWIGADHERACPQLGYRCKDCIEIAVAARMQDMELPARGRGPLPAPLSLQFRQREWSG
jgi:hypothetical protein